MRIITSAIIGMLSIAASCDGELDRVDAVRRIINESSAEAQITVSNAIDTVRFSLLPTDTIEFEGTCTYDERRFCDLGWEGSSRSSTRFIIDSADLIWEPRGDGPLPDSVRDLGVNPQFEQHGYVGETINGIIVYTFRILDSDIPE